mmetsp:Transcript_105783/g.252324  ORF Transcript_105783/g.252324 Transcript_105783/m.252324 type:complete len:236 (+) Transcript_105783:14-721(+)
MLPGLGRCWLTHALSALRHSFAHSHGLALRRRHKHLLDLRLARLDAPNLRQHAPEAGHARHLQGDPVQVCVLHLLGSIAWEFAAGMAGVDHEGDRLTLHHDELQERGGVHAWRMDNACTHSDLHVSTARRVQLLTAVEQCLGALHLDVQLSEVVAGEVRAVRARGGTANVDIHNLLALRRGDHEAIEPLVVDGRPCEGSGPNGHLRGLQQWHQLLRGEPELDLLALVPGDGISNH